MTSLPLLLSLFFQSSPQPIDTGMVVQGCLDNKAPRKILALRVWNASTRMISGLTLRLHLSGAPGSFDEMGWRVMDASLVDASGLVFPGVVNMPHGNLAPTLATAGCTQENCAYQVDLPLGASALSPLWGWRIELWPAKLVGGQVDSIEPARPPRRGDWSFSNLDSAEGCGEKLVAGFAHRATRIELFAGATRLWGNAPGESYERPNWPSADFRKASFASLMRTPSDTVPVSARDERNRTLGRWLVNQAGYRLSDVKAGRARVRGVGVASWTLIDKLGFVRGSGVAKPVGSRVSARLRTTEYENALVKLRDTTGAIRSGDLTEFVLPADLSSNGGPFRVVSGSDTSAAFSLDDDIYGKLRDASLRYFGVQRSGNASSWFRPASFATDVVPGGWYDCGDRLKEGVTSGFAMEVLGALAATHPERDPDRTSWLQSLETPDGVSDLVRELRHGADFALASWDLSGKDPANMVTGIGDFAKDHGGWAHDVWVDLLPATRGGPASRTGRKEMGGNVAGAWAAGLAFASRLQAAADPVFAQRALEAARCLYAWGKANPKVVNSMSYNDAESTAELALAAVALLWATGDTLYLHDLVRNDSIAKPKSTFWPAVAGGWFGKSAFGSPLSKGGWYMDWSSPHPLALHAFVHLILPHPDTASRYGVAAPRFDSLRDLAMAGVIQNLSNMPMGTRSIALPGGSLGVDSVWRFPTSSVAWGTSRFLAANFGEMLLYAHLARGFQAHPTPRYPAGTAFLADSVEAAAVRGMDYLLGQNPWDMSFVMGIGARNLNHIHHRTANPEGRSVPSVNWAYRTPVGALVGGGGPMDSLLLDDWMNYANSESCLDFAASFLVPATLLAKPASSGTTGRIVAPHRAPSPRLAWDARTGMLRWSAADAGLSWQIVDARGRVVGSGSSVVGEGRRVLEIPSGVSVLRWRTGEANGVLPLLRVGP